MAYGFELPVSVMNSPGNHMAHLAAALPNHIMMEVIDAGFEAVLNADNRIEDGYVVLGDSPGLGIEFDEGEAREDGGRPLRRQNERGPHGPPPRRGVVLSAGRGAAGAGSWSRGAPGVGRGVAEGYSALIGNVELSGYLSTRSNHRHHSSLYTGLVQEAIT